MAEELSSFKEYLAPILTILGWLLILYNTDSVVVNKFRTQI